MQSILEFSGSNIKTVGTMSTTTLTTVTSFEVILFCKNNVSLFGIVVVFSFYFLSYCHGHTTIIYRLGSSEAQNRERWNSCNTACRWAAAHHRKYAPGVNRSAHTSPPCVSYRGSCRGYTSLLPGEYFQKSLANHNRCGTWSRSGKADYRTLHNSRFR